jgi:DNA-binding NarL/FixJ family response regulator
MLAFGEVGPAVAELRALLDHPGLGLNRAQVIVDVALGLADLSRPEAARRALARAARVADTPWTQGVVAWGRAEVEWGSGRADRALAAAEAATEVARGPALAAAEAVRLWALHDLGRPEGGDPVITGFFFAALPLESQAFAALRDGDLALAEERLLQAADRWRGFLVRNELRARWAAAELAARSGHTSRARQRLLELEERAAAMPLASLLPRLRRGLQIVGRRSGRTASGDLTDREQQLLRLVAEGLTSPAIAERCGIARSTVETHIRSAVAKLGARTRLHAARLAGFAAPARGVLTAEQQALLELLAEGESLTGAAGRLGVSRRTATRRLAAARTALGARTTAEALAQIEDVARDNCV